MRPFPFFFLNKLFPTFKIAKYLWVYCLLAVHATLKLTLNDDGNYSRRVGDGMIKSVHQRIFCGKRDIQI